MAKNKLKEEVREQVQLQRLQRGFVQPGDDKKLWRKLKKKMSPMDADLFDAQMRKLLKPKPKG